MDDNRKLVDLQGRILNELKDISLSLRILSGRSELGKRIESVPKPKYSESYFARTPRKEGSSEHNKFNKE